MIYTVNLSVKAQLELFDGWVWYESERPGLGERFEREVFSKIEFIKNNPQLYPLKGRYKEAVIDTFPFIIVYQINKKKNALLVVSIFHTSRSPKKKK